MKKFIATITSFKAFLTKRMLCIFLLGFSSGLPLGLVGSSLQAWYTTDGLDIKTIGWLSLVGIPYSYKFLWAPLLDKYALLPLFGLRRGWLLLTQVLLLFAIIAISRCSPAQSPQTVALVATLIAFFSATQDIASDAYKIDMLPEKEFSFGAALWVEGYRVAMLISGAFSFILADKIGWNNTYLFISGFMGLGILATIFLAEKTDEVSLNKHNVFVNFKDAIKDFVTRKHFLLIIALILCYKLGDVFSHALTTVFLLKFLKFSTPEVGYINKVLGLAATLVGVFFGGLIITRIKLFRALLLFGVLQAVTNLLYVALALVGKNYIFACSAIFIENLCSGLGTAAFTTFLMKLCNKKFTATQYAIFTALSTVGRIYCGPLCAALVAELGWTIFYSISFFVSFPSLGLLLWLRGTLQQLGDNGAAVLVEQEHQAPPQAAAVGVQVVAR